MKINYSWLQSYFDDKLPVPEKLAEVLTMHSQEVEGVEKKGDDFIFDIKVLPNRNYDFVDYQGAIRDISAVLKIEPKKGLLKKPDNFMGEIPIKLSDIEKILGVSVALSETEEILTRLGFVIKKSDDAMFVFVPNFRTDVSNKEGLIGEIGRIFGYDRLEVSIPEGLLIPPKRNDILFFADISRNILASLGYSEVYNYSFSKKGYWELKNPPAKNKEFLRTNLVSGLEENYKNNEKFFKVIKIFEIGKVFMSDAEYLALGVLNNKADFYEMKGVVDSLLNGLGISEFYYKDHSNRVAEIYVDDKVIGHIDNNSFELNFEELSKLANETVEYRPISKFPAIVRDIAIFVPLNEKVDSVLDILENTAGELLVDADLFDIYENDERKSLAFHLVFQSSEKTLTDEEINSIMRKVFEAIEFNANWEIRK